MASRHNGSRAEVSARRRPIVVCGGAGFLGAHLCARLLDAGERVLCVDNFRTSDQESIGHLLKHPDFELLRRDVSSMSEHELGDVGGIFNMACAASPVHYQRSPLDTLFTSIRGTETLLRAAQRCRVKMFQASTSEIYGHPAVHPQTEEYWGNVNTMGPRSCYDEGKRCAETLCFIYQQEFAVPVRIGRIFNTYGPGMGLQDGRVVINFIVQALSGEPLTVYGEGKQTRSLCYVDDLIEAILRMMSSTVDIRGPVNMGNPAEITMLELAERIIELTDSDSVIHMLPLPVDDPPRRRPDISLATRVLGWRPRTDLDAGLTLTIRDVERRLRRGEMPTVATVIPNELPGIADALTRATAR